MDAHGGPGGWGPGPYGPPPPRRRRRTGLVVGAGVVVVAGLVVLALFLTGVFGGDDEGSSPTDVAGHYLQALLDGDRSAAGSEVCPADQSGLARQIADFARLQVTRFEAGQYHEKDATHVVVNAVVVTRQDSSDERPLDLPMVKQNGTWRVCVSNGDGSAAGSGPASAAASASWVPNSARAADVFAKISTLYNGLTNASSQAASDGNPVPVGQYVQAHNFPGLKYTANECTPAKAASRSDRVMYQPKRDTVQPDPSYTKVTAGRYSGTAVSGTVYRVTLEVIGPDGTQSAPTHVTEIDGTYYFFRICE